MDHACSRPPTAVRKVTAALSRLHLSLSRYSTGSKTFLMDGPPHRLAYVYRCTHIFKKKKQKKTQASQILVSPHFSADLNVR